MGGILIIDHPMLAFLLLSVYLLILKGWKAELVQQSKEIQRFESTTSTGYQTKSAHTVVQLFIHYCTTAWKSLTYLKFTFFRYLRFEYVPWKSIWFCFIFQVCTHFCNETKRFWFHESLKNDVRFEYVPWKFVWFCMFSLFAFLIVIKVSDTNFKNHWNTMIFFWPWKNVWFCSISPACIYVCYDSERFGF